MRSFLEAAGVTFLIVAVVTILVVGLYVWLAQQECNTFASLNPSIQTQFRFWGGCYAKTDNVWIPLKQFIVNHPLN